MTNIIQMVLLDIEIQIKLLGIKFIRRIVYNEEEIKEYETSLILVGEFRTLLLRINIDDIKDKNEVKIDEREINLDGLPVLEGLVAKFGFEQLGKLIRDIVEEIKKTLAARREKEAKEQDHKNDKEMVGEVKDIDGETELKLTRRDGSSIEIKSKKPAKKEYISTDKPENQTP